jgi:hypothetical protein
MPLQESEQAALTPATPPTPNKLKDKIVHEMYAYLFDFLYLSAFFVAFAWYRRLVLAPHGVPMLADYGMPLIEAAVLAKVIMVLNLFRLGRRWEGKPLIVPTLYKTLIFGVWIMVFAILEHTVRGLLRGEGLMGGLVQLMSTGREELLARCLVNICTLIPFFAVKEMGRVLGRGRLQALFFKGVAASGIGPGQMGLSVAQLKNSATH